LLEQDEPDGCLSAARRRRKCHRLIVRILTRRASSSQRMNLAIGS
jgi:hypothetical protein